MMTRTDLATLVSPVLDSDPQETAVWLEALDDVLRCAGPERTRRRSEAILNVRCARGLLAWTAPPQPLDIAFRVFVPNPLCALQAPFPVFVLSLRFIL
jgi:hypothetical protein